MTRQAAILWGAAVLPPVFLILLAVAYRRILVGRRRDIATLLGRTKSLRLYLTAHRSREEGDDTARVIAELFDATFHWRQYVLPTLSCALMYLTANAVFLVKAGFPLEIESALVAELQKLSTASAVALGGAWLWGMHDLLHRFRTEDLAPTAYHFVWLRLLIATALGALVAVFFEDEFELLIAFGVGAFPIDTLRAFVRQRFVARFELSRLSMEEASVGLIQGVTQNVADRLVEEGIESVEHLANADPVKLLLRTNLPWRVIIDLIDQAFLVNYIGDRIRPLRAIGFRGAIEMAALGRELQSSHAEVQARAKELLQLLTEKLNENEAGVRQLIETNQQDRQVRLLWALFRETLSDSMEDDGDA